MRLKLFYEEYPVLADLSEYLREKLNGLILVHLLMNFAEILVIPCGLPTLIVITTVDFAFLGLILSEV